MARPDGFVTWWRARCAGLRAGAPSDVDDLAVIEVNADGVARHDRVAGPDPAGGSADLMVNRSGGRVSGDVAVVRPGALVDHVLAEFVSPFMAEQGFGRRGRSYRRDAPHWLEVVNVQSDMWNSSEAVGLRVNVGLFHPESHRALWREDPPSLPLESHCQVRLVLGDLGDGGRPVRRPRDDWFRWEPDLDPADLGRGVREALRTRVLPFLSAHRDWPDLRRLGHGRYPGESEQASAALAWYAGEPALARRELARVARRGRSYRRQAYEVACRLGLPFDEPEGEYRVVLTVVPTDTATVEQARRAADGLWLDLVELFEDDQTAYVYGDVRSGGRPWIELFGRDLGRLRARIAGPLAERRRYVAEIRLDGPASAEAATAP